MSWCQGYWFLPSKHRHQSGGTLSCSRRDNAVWIKNDVGSYLVSFSIQSEVAFGGDVRLNEVYISSNSFSRYLDLVVPNCSQLFSSYAVGLRCISRWGWYFCEQEQRRRPFSFQQPPKYIWTTIELKENFQTCRKAVATCPWYGTTMDETAKRQTGKGSMARSLACISLNTIRKM